MSSLAKPPSTKTPWTRKELWLVSFPFLYLAFIAFWPSIYLKLQDEPEILAEDLIQRRELQEDFVKVFDIIAIDRRPGRSSQRRWWISDEKGGYFTFEVDGLVKQFGTVDNRRITYQVVFLREPGGNLRISNIIRNPSYYR
jgi:hypothetical protein